MYQKKRSLRARHGIRPFLMTLPFLIATLIFSYLPLYGWRYAFFDYKAGFKLLDCNFVGLKHFLSLFQNQVILNDVGRVLQNTFAISLIGIATSFLPMLFAIFLSEIRNRAYRRTVQTITTIPNFISWVLVYSMAYAIFSVNDGFVNNLLVNLGLINDRINFLASPNNVWITMWGYGTWKGLGWSSIMYVASISSIDEQLFEAAAIDGASRMKRIWYITIPSLMPTFFVLLLLNIANFLNNGIDQYFVFQNAMNKAKIEVLDLYVYNKGIAGSNISFSTAVGMLKSVISIVLLFIANTASKLVRDEKII
ncbi:MAG: ABC transporter permease subunit [Clostridiaceae bacterium]|nr:ABC transporter permease subunit [Clostridiaceae bacterium]